MSADGRSGTGFARVYGLVDPFTGDLKYVGCASSPETRLSGHLCPASYERTPKAIWIRRLKAKGGRPRIVHLTGNRFRSVALNIESRFIENALSRGLPLLNSGGTAAPSKYGFRQRPYPWHDREISGCRCPVCRKWKREWHKDDIREELAQEQPFWFPSWIEEAL